MANHPNNYPKLHNAAWPGVVGKGDGGEPPIDLDTMLDLTAAAEVDGQKFDGFDLFLFAPHINIDATDDESEIAGRQGQPRGLVIGSVVAPVWPPTGGGSAMGSDADRQQFLEQVRKGCRIAKRLREFGIRSEGVVRIDSASSVAQWYEGRSRSQHAPHRRHVSPGLRNCRGFRRTPGSPRAKSAGAGMHSWRRMVQLLEMVDRPQTLGFQADMAHTLLYVLGINAPEDAILPADFDWRDTAKLDAALKQITAALRPWTMISTSPRTTPRFTAPARTTRPAGTACRTIRTANWIS